MSESKESAIGKAMQILRFFESENRPSTIQELSRSLGLKRATVHRTVQTLVEYGMLRHELDGSRVSLGGAILALGTSLTHSLRSGALLESARPHLVRLREKTGCGVTLELFSGMRNILLFALKGLRVVSFAGSQGDVMPWHAAAGAKATLANVHPDELAQLLSERMFPFTPNTITNPDRFLAELKSVRRKGYATDLGETQLGVNAVAVPFFSYDGRPAGAVVAMDVGLDLQGPEPEIITMVRDAAQAISTRNFAPGSQPS
ncbi:IclR family transcriptional regulator [Desulfovibrio sp. Huiquan2017]|uniref:IclR family transcriptional regulator n=1 Tax=Desulfovibrio sp. Huiquan2017 TaxID=2816861 RepID=UPI001A91E721|nr:IclR family transcriptional regulator [Desulfovibrio sp. Huiquan2017]